MRKRTSVFFLIFALMCVACRVILYSWDPDAYFLVATGREIVEHGIPYTNVWAIDSDLGIVVQQWLYAVIIYFADKLGVVGYSLLSLLWASLLFFVTWVFLGKKRPFACFLVILSCFPYFLCARPETVTVILLLIECICLERVEQNPKWLIGLPLTTLLEVNLHSSMWVFHFCILIAYLVRFPIKSVKSSVIRSKKLIITALFMVGSLFINPYGLDNVLYLFKSYRADTFGLVSVVELSKTAFVSIWGVTIIIGFIALIICHRKGTLTSTTLNITLGFGVLAAMACRNIMFFSVAIAFILRDLETVKIKVNFNRKQSLLIEAGAVLAMVCLVVSVLTQKPLNVIADENYGDMYEYIVSSDIANPKVFTMFEAGSYLEYKGLRNVYSDARPELFTSEFTKGKNILADISCMTNGNGTNAEKTEAWLDEYNFDFMILPKTAMPYLLGYLECSPRYERCVESKEAIMYISYKWTGRGFVLK